MRERVVITTIALLSLTYQVVRAEQDGSSAAAPKAESQVWLLIHVLDRFESGQKVEVQVPIEWIRDLGPVKIHPVEGAAQVIEGAWIYDTYKDLPLGQEEQIAEMNDPDTEVHLRVASRQPLQGKVASKVRVMVGQEGDDNALDIRVPIKAVKFLEKYFLDSWEACDRCRKVVSGLESLRTEQFRLQDLAPFELVRVEGAGSRVIVRTESD